MTRTDLPLPQLRGLGETSRQGLWWLQPAAVFIGFGAFVVYATWAALQGRFYFYSDGGAQYLSPFYSPVLFSDQTVPGHAPLDHSLFGAWPEWLPKRLLGFIPLTPAVFILWAPAGFRFTCYYYRGAYYKAFWADPPSCSVGEPGFRGRRYRGEQTFPLILQNIHRYFLYLALLFVVILSYDAVLSYIFTDADGSKRFGIGLGSLVLTINPILIAGYTFGCHSLRHLVGGGIDCVSERPLRHACYKGVSCFNRRHMFWAWVSLFWVAFADIYVRLCASGMITDWRIL